MKKLHEVIKTIESFADPDLARFDFVGLLQGDLDKEILKIGLTLDYSLQAIQKAIDSECDLLITHHGPTEIRYPLVGNNLKKITAAANRDLAVYRSHLSLDFCDEGIITQLCSLLEIPAKPVTTRYERFVIRGGVFLAEDYFMTFSELKNRIKRGLKVNSFRIAGPKKEKFRRIAVTSGKGFISEFFDQLKPEVYIAGEFEQEATKYAEDNNIMLVELSHHASEVRALEKVAPILAQKIGIEVVAIEIPDTIKIEEV